jgi:hypothetical protein
MGTRSAGTLCQVCQSLYVRRIIYLNLRKVIEMYTCTYSYISVVYVDMRAARSGSLVGWHSMPGESLHIDISIAWCIFLSVSVTGPDTSTDASPRALSCGTG